MPETRIVAPPPVRDEHEPSSAVVPEDIGPTYETFYGLSEKPFNLSPDPRFFFSSDSHDRVLTDLLAAIGRRDGVAVLTGESGIGKTTVCRTALERLGRTTFTALALDPFGSVEDLLKTLLVDFGVVSADDVKGGRLDRATRQELNYALYEFLRSLVPLQASALVIIDQAQSLPPAVLEEIRILSDLDSNGPLLQIVLAGQPGLLSQLKQSQMRQLDLRVSTRLELAPLALDEVASYVAHRLLVAGGGHVEFTPEALDLVAIASNGVPHAINRICDQALTEGYLASATTIDAPLARVAIHEVGYELPAPPPAPAGRALVLVASLLLMLLAGAAAGVYVNSDRLTLMVVQWESIPAPPRAPALPRQPALTPPAAPADEAAPPPAAGTRRTRRPE